MIIYKLKNLGNYSEKVRVMIKKFIKNKIFNYLLPKNFGNYSEKVVRIRIKN